MSVTGTRTATIARWGYCPRCERWRLTDAWDRDAGPPRCPVCGSRPDPLEHHDGTSFSVLLHLGGDERPREAAPV